MKPAGNRQQRRHPQRLEQRAIENDVWGLWRVDHLRAGIPGGSGWCREVRTAYANDLYAVLVRPVDTPWGEVHHLAIRTASSLEPPWRDKQRIKDELFGERFTAVEVMPPRSELIDEADMYHVWVLPEGMRLPFTIGKREHGGAFVPELTP